ncbi:uncharacterized protein [Anabrus simplex]|uniref:uncharacterized protein n=1 Tax=Anabrus simplex TaxID=316456 RepID=UPI0035A39BDA
MAAYESTERRVAELIFVFDLPDDTSEEQLTEYFQARSVQIIRNPQQVPIVFAVVRFGSDIEARNNTYREFVYRNSTLVTRPIMMKKSAMKSPISSHGRGQVYSAVHIPPDPEIKLGTECNTEENGEETLAVESTTGEEQLEVESIAIQEPGNSLRRSIRQRKGKTYADCKAVMGVRHANIVEPRTVEEAMSSQESANWMEAMKMEINEMRKKDVWEITWLTSKCSRSAFDKGGYVLLRNDRQQEVDYDHTGEALHTTVSQVLKTMKVVQIATVVLLCLCYSCSVPLDGRSNLKIISRAEWGGRPPVATDPLGESPTPYVVVHHGGTKNYCFTEQDCSQIVRTYQSWHMDNNAWNDIGYSFVIGEDGLAYEGRGWDRLGAHAPGYNNRSIGICIIGDFTDRLPDDAALTTLGNLITYGVELGKIRPDYHTIGHRQAKATECPGNKLYDYITKWPSWIANPSDWLTVLDHPPYSPDLAPCDFALFPELKMKLNRRRFASGEELLAAWDQECENVTEEKWQIWFSDWFRYYQQEVDYDHTGEALHMTVSQVLKTMKVVQTAAVVLLCLCCSCSVPLDGRSNLKIISRAEWGGRPPVATDPLGESPTPYVVVHHGGTKNYCFTEQDCSQIVRTYQSWHMDNNEWYDIGYSFVIGEDGLAYEGRGWDRLGAHAPGYNNRSIGICIIGDFTDRLPDDAALTTLENLITYGVELGKIRPDYHTIGHRQATATECPGNKLYDYITKWPSWIANPSDLN